MVGNVADLLATVDYIGGMTGFHEFAEFTAEDVGTVDSGLNSMVRAILLSGAQFFGAHFSDAAASCAQVLASNNERVLR